MSTTTVRLRPEVERGLENMATCSRRSKSWLINEALEDYLRRKQTESVRWQETLAAMESVARGDVVSGDAVHAWLKSWGTADESGQPGTDG